MVSSTCRLPAAAAAALLAALLPAACVPPGPESEPETDMSLFLRWTIDGREPDPVMCRSLARGPVRVEMWEDSDCDGNLGDGFYVYGFECAGGVCMAAGEASHGEPCGTDGDCGGGEGSCVKAAGRTPTAFFSGTDTCVQMVLVAGPEDPDDPEAEDVVISWASDFSGGVCGYWCEEGFCYDTYEDCPEDCYCEVDMGEVGQRPSCRMEGQELSSCRDLGEADFNLPLEDFGPLHVALFWETESGGAAACGEAGVDAMGYLLERRYDPEEGETEYGTVDERSLEEGGACRGELGWPSLPLGFYRLRIEGRNESGSVLWDADCRAEGGGDIEVSGSEENEYACLVRRF